MKFQYIQNIARDEATILIYDHIGRTVDDMGREVGIDGAAFARELYYLAEMNKKIKARINSVGGLVLDAQKMFAAMVEVGVDTYNDGLAASSAGILMQAGKKRYAADYSMFMAHNVSNANGEPDMTAKEKEVSEIFQRSAATMLSTNSGIPIDAILEKMNRETWIIGQQQVDEGFADDIFYTARKPKIEASFPPKKVYAICNSFLTTNKSMEKVNKIFGLKNDASEEIIADAASKLKEEHEASAKKAQELEDENKVLKGKVAELEALVEEAKKKKSEELVENAFKAGKIKNEGKESFLKLALKDFDSAKSALESIAEARVKFNNMADRGAAGKDGDERADWGHKEWSKNDPEGLKKIMANDKERYNQLLEKSYGK